MGDHLEWVDLLRKELCGDQNKWFGLRKVRDCFAGKEAIDLIVERDSSQSRESVVKGFRELQSSGYLYHIGFQHLFEDHGEYYRLSSSEAWENDPKDILNMRFPLLAREEPDTFARFMAISAEILSVFVDPLGRSVEYQELSTSPLLTRYEDIAHNLMTLDLSQLAENQRIAFLINLYNMMTIHGIIRHPRPDSNLGRSKWFKQIVYVVGGLQYSLDQVENGLLRRNAKPPYGVTPPFGGLDPRAQFVITRPEPRIHFALVCAAKSCPRLRFFSSEHLEEELESNTKDFMEREIIIFPDTYAIESSLILYWFIHDFGGSNESVLRFVAPYLPEDESKIITDIILHDRPRLCYRPYDWSLNKKE